MAGTGAVHWKDAAIALLVALVTALVWFPSIVFVIARFSRCPPTAHPCDLPTIGAVGLGIFTTPVVFVLTGVLTYLQRRKRSRAATI